MFSYHVAVWMRFLRQCSFRYSSNKLWNTLTVLEWFWKPAFVFFFFFNVTPISLMTANTTIEHPMKLCNLHNAFQHLTGIPHDCCCSVVQKVVIICCQFYGCKLDLDRYREACMININHSIYCQWAYLRSIYTNIQGKRPASGLWPGLSLSLHPAGVEKRRLWQESQKWKLIGWESSSRDSQWGWKKAQTLKEGGVKGDPVENRLLGGSGEDLTGSDPREESPLFPLKQNLTWVNHTVWRRPKPQPEPAGIKVEWGTHYGFHGFH